MKNLLMQGGLIMIPLGLCSIIAVAIIIERMIYMAKIQKGRDELIKVAVADHFYLRPFADFHVLNIRHEFERDTADYFVLPVYRDERNQFYKDKYEMERLRDTITVAGVDYYEIYKVEGKK